VEYISTDILPMAKIKFRCLIGALLIAISICGCASRAPIADTPKLVATPLSGQLTFSAKAAAPIGSVTPVYVSIANGTNVPRSVVPSQIFALDESGDRVAPLPPGEAGRQAGGAGALKSALSGAARRGVVEGALGAAIGAIAGSFLGGAGTGAALGGAIGGGEGLINGAISGQQEAKAETNQQLGALALAPGEVRHDFTVSGYVFFPKGEYQSIEFLVVNDETGDTEVLKTPWH
jgi:hypothetical protein